jgi:hypothetical protein
MVDIFFCSFRLFSIHPGIDDFRIKQPADGAPQSALRNGIMIFFLKAERSMLIAPIRK